MKSGDLIYQLLCYVNTSSRVDLHYTIALTILENLHKIPKCSVNELAKMCYTSTASISRFCRYFGFESYIQFKKGIAAALEVAEREIIIEKFSEEEKMNPQLLVDKVYNNVFESLGMNKDMDIRLIDDLAKLIHDSNKVHFFGSQFNKIVATDIQMKFMKLGKFIYAFNSRGENDLKYESLDEDSLVIYLSVRASSDDVLDAVSELRKRDVKIALITCNSNSKYKKYFDYYYYIPGIESDFTDSSIMGTFNILTALNVLYIRYGLLYKSF